MRGLIHLSEFRIVPIFKTAEQIEKQLKEAQEFLKKHPLPPRRDPKDVTQAASTQRLLAMTDEELDVYRNRPLPSKEDWKRDHTEKGNWTLDQVVTIEGLRRSGRHIEHDSSLSSATDLRKELARQAFTCTPAAELTDEQKERLTTLSKITEYKGEVEQETGLFDSLKKWFRKYAPVEERKSYAEMQEILRKETK